MTKVERLEKRLEEMTGGGDGNVWIPGWLAAVGSREEIVEWRAILLTRRGQDQAERRLEFQQEMRRRHPDMPLTFEEQLEAGRKELESNPELRRAEGLDAVESSADERGGE